MLSLSNPTIAVTGNLRWTRTGVVYAEWLLSPRPGGYESAADKQKVVWEHRHLFTDLGQGVFTSVVAPIDIAAIAARIIQPEILDRFPDYVTEASAQLNDIELQDPPPRERIKWLSVPLCAPARTGPLEDDFQPSVEDRAHFEGLAAQAQRKIPGVFAPQPVTPQQMQWLWMHAHVRGVAPQPFPHTAAPEPIRRARGFRTDGLLDEALATDGLPRRAMVKAVKVSLTDSDIAPSYQSLLVVDAFPARLSWPGVADQLFAVLNHFDGLGIDYTLRTRTRARTAAIADNARSLRQLSEQMDERNEEVSFAQHFLLSRGQHLSAYNTHLEDNPSETEIHFCPIIAVAAPSQEELEDRVREVTRTFHDAGVSLLARYGAQSELWAATQPGYPDSRASQDYSHFMPTDGFGMFMPITSARIGDDSGPIIGRNRLSGFDEPVHFDLLGTTEKDKSASFMAVGELGSGKSVFLKVVLGQAVDLGAQVYCVDRTDLGEYEVFANAITDAVVLDVSNPGHTMDPLRVFTGPDAGERALTVLMPLFDIHAGSPQSVLLSDLLNPNYRARYRILSLPDLAAHLSALQSDPARAAAIPPGADPEALAALAGQLRFWAQRTYARVLFAPELPPLPMDTAMVVLRTHRLQLPAEGEDPREQPVKLFGQTIYGLFAAIAQQALFDTPGKQSRFGLLMLDEASFLLNSTVGQQVMRSFILDGRKHHCAVAAASQAPAHFGDLVRLIPTRFVFRQTDRHLAIESLQFLGVDTDTEEHLVKQLMTATSPATEENGKAAPHRRGECFMRDLKGRLAPIKILLPARADRSAAVLTTPTRQATP